MNHTFPNACHGRCLRRYAGCLLLLLCIHGGLPEATSQEPGPLLANPHGVSRPARTKPRLGLGNPVSNRSIGLPDDANPVRTASLQIEKPLPKPASDRPVAPGVPAEPLRMPAASAPYSMLPPPGAIVHGYAGTAPQTMLPGVAPGCDAACGVCPSPACGPECGSLCDSWGRGPFTSLVHSVFGPINHPLRGTDLRCWDCMAIPHPKFRASFEYLLWSVKDDVAPPLVTSGVPGTGAALGSPGTVILFGGPLDQGTFSGGRLFMNYWLDCYENLGVDGSFFMLGQRRSTYSAGSPGSPVVAHPFFEADQNRENFVPVAGTDVGLGDIAGNTTVSYATRILGADLNLRKHIGTGCWLGLSWTMDTQIGVRYVRLDESLSLTDNITCMGTIPGGCPAGTRLLAEDQFKTLNNFYGGQIGLDLEYRKGPWGLNLRGKVALGVTQQSVEINGATTFFQPNGGGVEIQTGGVYALPSNIGVYSRSVFSVVPEVGIVLSYHLNEQWRVFAGYNALAWTNVVRPGRQIDRVLDSANLLPQAGRPTPTGFRPSFNFEDSNFLTHGFTGGLEYKF